MKKAFKLFFAMILLVASVKATERSRSTFHVDVLGERELAVEVSNVQGFSQVYIYDQLGAVVGSKRVDNKATIRFVFDLSYLEAGNYTLSIEDKVKKQEFPVSVLSDRIRIDTSEMRKVFFPQAEKKEDMLLVRMLSNVENDLNIRIYSVTGDILHEEEIMGRKGLVGKNFKFRPGKYFVSLSSEGYSESYEFTF